jgi:hypothetical protein
VQGDPANIANWSAIENIANQNNDETGWGADEPCAGVDAKDNIHVVFWHMDGGRVYGRSKINGVWENTHTFNPPWSIRGSQCALAVHPDGRVCAVWREKLHVGGVLDYAYKTYYNKRTATEAWWADAKRATPGANSHSNPWVAYAPDGTLGVVFRDLVEEGPCEVISMVINDDNNPRELAIGTIMQHNSRIVFDSANVPHVATQLGGGDFGNGIVYANKVSGSWSEPEIFGGAMPKTPGLAAEAYGNVAVGWVNFISGSGTEIWISTLYPVVTKYFKAPSNAVMTIKLKNAHKAPQITYSLSWAANPDNTNQYLKGYNIYISENGGAYQLLTSVDKAVFSSQFTYQDLNKKRRFGISTVSISGAESEIVVI